MQRAVRKAAPRLRRDFGEVEQLQVSKKGPGDFVTMADKRAEQTIVEELRTARPDWGLLLEEQGEIAGNPDKPRWIVDPLDGTTNFLHGIPHFAISIAVEDKKPDGRTEIVAGLGPVIRLQGLSSSRDARFFWGSSVAARGGKAAVMGEMSTAG